MEADLKRVRTDVARLRERVEKAEENGQVELHVQLSDVRLLIGLAEVTLGLYEQNT
jgi:hypothetical protein